MRFRDAEHLARLAGLFLVGGVLFVVVRAALVPDDFGVYGHYRAGALADNASRPIAYAGQPACLECHSDAGGVKRAGAHAPVSCEACHGPLAPHAAGEVTTPPRPGPTLCLVCHATSTGRPAWMKQIVPAEHAGEEGCTTCHQPHTPRIQ
jgi:Cytochrome c7 and related cytochrome c